jgi:DNA invertase Pin-like site-specific DNA recombinase
MLPSNTSAAFGYCRVSTAGQATENQRLELERAGYDIRYWFQDEGVSGKCPAAQRPAFQDLLSKIRRGETLVVSKMDRLGRDAIDVLQTVRLLQERGVHVIVHQLGNTDLTSPAGKLLLTMLSALAEMERDLLVERTQAGLARAKAEGKQLGRKAKTNDAQRQDIRQRLEAGESVSSVARGYAISRANVIGIRDRAD